MSLAPPRKQRAAEGWVTTPGRWVAQGSTHGSRAAQVALPQSLILLSVAMSLYPNGNLSTPSPQKCAFASTTTRKKHYGGWHSPPQYARVLCTDCEVQPANSARR